MIKDITLRGIERNSSVSQVVDGALDTVVGLRRSAGDWRPQPGLETLPIELHEHEVLLFTHRNDSFTHYIFYDETLSYIIIRNAHGDVIHSELSPSIRQAHSLGNILILVTLDEIRTYIFDNDSYYSLSRSNMPYAGIIWEPALDEDGNSITHESDHIDIIPDVHLGNTSDIIGDHYPYQVRNKHVVRQLTEQVSGLIANFRTNASLDNTLVDSYLVRYGFRLFDGNYIYVSEPLLIKTDEYSINTGSASWNINNGWDKLQDTYVRGTGYRLSLDVSLIDMDDSLIAGKMIKDLDVFLSLPITRYDNERTINAVTSASLIGGDPASQAYYELQWGAMKPMRDNNIEQYFNFYRVASFTMDEIATLQDNGGIATVDIRDKIDTIEQQPLLNYDNSPHSYSASSSLIYNGRLHIANLQEQLFNGNALHFHALHTSLSQEIEGDDSFLQDSYIVFTHIRAEQEEYIVQSDVTHHVGTLSTYMSYPDSRAYKMVILSLIDGQPYMRTLLLREHPFMNTSYYFDGWNSQQLLLNRPIDEITTEEYTRMLFTTTRNIVKRNNIIKVSELNNPLLLPLDKTYSVGNGNIIAMAIATHPISQGQFGEYPLYVFSQEGVWAMSVGNTSIAYGNVAPINRDVVDNPHMVCGIDNGVVYGTSEQLYILRGNDRTPISPLLDSHGVRYNGEHSLHEITATLTGIQYDNTTLNTLLSEGHIAYHYDTAEIFLFRPNIGTVYAYSITETIWTTYDLQLTYTVNDYPHIILVVRNDTDTDILCRMAHDDSDNIASHLLLVTRPMAIDSILAAKRVNRIHIPAFITGDDNTVMTIAVAVSNDGYKWSLAWNRTMRVKVLHNITLPHVAGAYRYYSLIIRTTNISKNSYLAGHIIAQYDIKRVER